MSKGEATALVIGGGVAGLEAALKLGQGGYRVVLVEKEACLGGNVTGLYSSFPRWEDPQESLQFKLHTLRTLDSVTTLLNTTVTGVERQPGGFTVAWANSASGESGTLTVQAVIVAVGFSLFDASVYGEYGYGIYPNVVHSLEFEALLKKYAEDNIPMPKSIAFFKCIGSRDRSKGHPYCSKICCMYTAKQAGMVKKLSPVTNCYVFYMDYRATGKEYEEFVRSVIENEHVRYVRGRPAKVVMQNGRLLVRSEDTLIGVPVEVPVDMVVLASAVVPRPETRALAEMLDLTTDEYGFIEPMYGAPAKAGNRIFWAGACGFAVETAGAATQGAAAAAEVMALFNQSEPL